MTNATSSRVGRVFGRTREVWSELDYAQRRLLEIQTGVPMVAQTRAKGRGRRANLVRLQADRLPIPPDG